MKSIAFARYSGKFPKVGPYCTGSMERNWTAERQSDRVTDRKDKDRTGKSGARRSVSQKDISLVSIAKAAQHRGANVKLETKSTVVTFENEPPSE